MLRSSVRYFNTSAILKAGTPSRGKTQSFARKGNNSTDGYKSSKKNISGSLHKKWIESISTGKFHEKAPIVETQQFNSQNLNKVLNSVVCFSNSQYQTLYRLGSFKQNQFNELFQKPVTLVRELTTKKLLEQLSTDKKIVLTGERGIGKSTLLAQLHACIHETHIILHFSHPELFLNGRNDFLPDKGQYIQPMYLKSLLTKFLKSNRPELLRSIKLSESYKFQNADIKDSSVRHNKELNKGQHTLFDLLNIKTVPKLRGKLFGAVIHELSVQKAVPVTLTIDNFSRLVTSSFTAYRDTNNKPISTLDFQIAKTLFDIISGDISFGHNSSSVILALCGSDRSNRTLPIGLGKLPHDPYLKQYHYDPEFAAKLLKGNVKEFPVARLNEKEVSVLLDFYKQAGVAKPTDSFEEKYFLSGNGNPRELLKSAVMNFY
ncbi:related to 37S ribosomal protein S23, mitochondrial [Saccharomycodes ludwigii]|uniref:Small ribosomal subunit protein mS29 n=1 Tax=Saccharomycodes ludwigii TaxID=36035 RepID=A0A376BBA2_9ASCO|nr:hypothetical protein SCDLUD_001114 [Saccharomycodes ludwigii]KAH3903474.1 hypothetical protein SCDLUD_001114 [Saccharomycodes ludwigii]SSD61834.1 related to 37S ribosomal protein S23, mitochondrial [Saccharomycodes ludwigii]